MTSNSGEDTACLRISLNAKDLVENVIITVECFLPIKEGADDGAGGIIDSKMKDGLAFPEPEMKRAVHSDFFAEVFTALLTRMSVLKSDLATDNRLNFVFRDGRGIRQQFSFCELFSSSPANMRRQDIIRTEKAIDSRVGNVNVLVLR